jgi:sodium-coupled monocarboxylate transporter 8/12
MIIVLIVSRSGLKLISLLNCPTDGTTTAKNMLFTWPDYLVFAISLSLPIGIGVFFFFYKRKQNTIEMFLMGERSINFVAVALSILASIINGIFIIGTPAEMHYYGMTQSYIVVGLLVAVVITSHLFVPKYQKMTFTSAYEVSFHQYLEHVMK